MIEVSFYFEARLQEEAELNDAVTENLTKVKVWLKVIHHPR
jgi:hypothetical protein